MEAHLTDLACCSGSSSGQHEGEQQLVLLKQPPLHLIKDEARGKGGEQAQAGRHI